MTSVYGVLADHIILESYRGREWFIPIPIAGQLTVYATTPEDAPPTEIAFVNLVYVFYRQIAEDKFKYVLDGVRIK